MADKKTKKDSGAVLLSQITDQTAEGEVTIGEVVIAFTYRPYVIDVETVLKAASDDFTEDVAEQLARVLISWNLSTEDDEEFPPTVENIKKIPVEAALKISMEISNPAAMGEAAGSFADT